MNSFLIVQDLGLKVRDVAALSLVVSCACHDVLLVRRRIDEYLVTLLSILLKDAAVSAFILSDQALYTVLQVTVYHYEMLMDPLLRLSL